MYKIGIIMGSDSDLPVMKEAAQILEEFNIEYEITIISAHRTPERMYDYAKTASERGINIIIAGAGGSAHLPGMTAAITSIPVIGVPIKTKTLNGIDSLYSIVQMPFGIPVATVAINGAKNAALLAVQIIGSFDKEISKKVLNYKNDMKEAVINKADRLESIGYNEYLNKKSN